MNFTEITSVTRISVVPLDLGEGLLSNFGTLAVAMLNIGLRPVLARWHPALEDWEAARPKRLSRGEHERAWDHAAELRAALDALRGVLTQYAQLMAAACGVPDLLQAGTLSQEDSDVPRN